MRGDRAGSAASASATIWRGSEMSRPAPDRRTASRSRPEPRARAAAGAGCRRGRSGRQSGSTLGRDQEAPRGAAHRQELGHDSASAVRLRCGVRHRHAIGRSARRAVAQPTRPWSQSRARRDCNLPALKDRVRPDVEILWLSGPRGVVESAEVMAGSPGDRRARAGRRRPRPARRRTAPGWSWRCRPSPRTKSFTASGAGRVTRWTAGSTPSMRTSAA